MAASTQMACVPAYAGTTHAVSLGDTQSTLLEVMVPVQHALEPPGRVPQSAPPHVPHDAAQHAELLRMPSVQLGSEQR